jgi:hypothetical protein
MPFCSECHSVPGGAGISARETPCVRLPYFEHASRAKMPALPGKAAGCVTSVTRIRGRQGTVPARAYDGERIAKIGQARRRGTSIDAAQASTRHRYRRGTGIDAARVSTWHGAGILPVFRCSTVCMAAAWLQIVTRASCPCSGSSAGVSPASGAAWEAA